MTESFAALLDESLSTLDMQPGSIVSGVVLDVDKDWVTVHVGLKSEGVVSLDEFRNNEGELDISVGDEVEVALEAVEDGYGETRISREKARKIATWKMLEDALESGEFVTGKIINRVKGGFSVEVEVVVTSSLIFGKVKVLFVKVCVPVRVTSFASPIVAS